MSNTQKGKKIIKYLLYASFLVCGVISINIHPQYSFYWWTGIINVAGWGGYFMFKIISYLED